MRRSDLLVLLSLLPGLARAESPVAVSNESGLNRLTLTQKAAERIAIQLGNVERSKIPRLLRCAATVVPRPGASATIVAPFAGTILPPPNLEDTPLPGTDLTRDQIVLRLRPVVAPSGTLGTETRRELAQAEARNESAQRGLARAQKMLADGAGNRAQLDAAEEAAKLAEAELSASRQRLGRLGSSAMSADVSMPLRAPMDGTLMRVHVSAGQPVNAGDKIADIVDRSQLWIRAEIHAGVFDRIDPKAPASVYSDKIAKPLLAERIVAPPVARALGGAVVEIEYQLREPGDLIAFSRVEADLPLAGSDEAVLSVPWSAVLYDVNGGAWVYAAVGDLSFERRRIEVRSVVDDRAVLARGPEEGTRVVTSGATELFGTEFGIGK